MCSYNTTFGLTNIIQENEGTGGHEMDDDAESTVSTEHRQTNAWRVEEDDLTEPSHDSRLLDISMERENDSAIRNEDEGRSCRNKCLGASALVLVLVIGSFIAGLNLGKKSEQSKDQTSQGPNSVAQVGNEEIIVEQFLDKRFEFSKTCNGPVCTLCKTEVPSPAQDYGHSRNCPVDRNVFNSTCYKCGTTCKNATQLQKDPTCNNRAVSPVELCCIIPQMLGDSYCGFRGKFRCFGHVPKCECPRGKGGERCQDDTQLSLACNCYKTHLKACGQDSMEECSNVTKWDSNKSCYMYANRAGQKNNCKCSKKDDEFNFDELDLCSSPHTDAQHENVSNDYRKLFPDILLILSSIFLVASLVDISPVVTG